MLRSRKVFRCEEEVEPRSPNQPEGHPLLNKIVLKTLFEFCKLEDLFDYRLVSKEWYSSSLPRIRKEATVVISNARLKKRRDGGLNWNNFHDNFQVSGKQFQSFKLGHVEFLDSPAPSEPPGPRSHNWVLKKRRAVNIQQLYKNMAQFLGQWGQFIHILNLELSTVYSVEAFKKAIFEDMPNLEKLTLWEVDIEVGQDVPQHVEGNFVNVNPNMKELSVRCWPFNERFPISWSLLFDHFPNIRALTLEVSVVQVVIAALMKKLESQEEILLKDLQLRSVLSDHSHLVRRLFQLPNLKLTSLYLEFYLNGFGEEDRRILEAALRFQGSNLESLTIWNRDGCIKFDALEPMNNFPFRTEPFLQLTRLELRGALSPSFHFLQQTPNLKTLRVSYNFSIKPPDEGDLETLGNTKLPFLEEFYFGAKCITSKSMKIFVKMMPNVERFHAFLSSRAFQVVCANWRQLRELVIDKESDWDARRQLPEVDYVGDEAITGIVDGREDRRPNITHLECLEKIEIKNAGKISDASIWNGFLKLPKLFTLAVTLSPETSVEAYDALEERFPYGKIRRRDPPPPPADSGRRLQVARKSTGGRLPSPRV